MADDNKSDDLKARYESLLAEASAKIKELEDKKNQLIDALNWNQGYYEKSIAFQEKYDELVKTISDSNVSALLEDAKKQVSEITKEHENISNVSKQAVEERQKLEKIVADIQGFQKSGQQLLDGINQIKTQVDQQHANVGKVSSFADEASKTLQTVKTGQEDWTRKSKKALEEFSANVNAKLVQFEKDIVENTKKAKKLLGYATDASLAHAFNRKKWGMFWTSFIWNVIFVCAVLAMVWLALDNHATVLQGEGYLFGLLLKLPYLAPLIWLAYFAQGRSGLYSRLSDDYGYKESVSIAFDGYLAKVSEVEVSPKGTDPKPAEVLVRQTLQTLGHDPERIHAVYKAPPTPFEGIVSEGIKATTSQVNEVPIIGSLKKWLVGIGISSGLAIVAIIWLVIKILGSATPPLH